MGLIIAFIVFIISMIAMLITQQSMVWALLIGLVLFTGLGIHTLCKGTEQLKMGDAVKELAIFGWGSIKDSLIVIEVMLIIGFITAAWRVSGTITVFVYYGMKVIVPPLFLIITFLLACLLSYALGTSFGVAGTVGVIFMALARSGGVDPVLTAGVLMSGIYFGDRGSPVSSSANMVAGVTKTDILTNVRLMMKTAALPLGITLGFYGIMSFMNPISHVDEGIISSFEEEFTLSPWAFNPAVIMILLPLLKVGVIPSIAMSIIASVIVAWLVEKVALLEIFRILLMGYHSNGDGLGAILDGGGLISMLEIVIILIISCAYSGIFTRTNMLNSLLVFIQKGCTKMGRYAMTFIISLLSGIVFCNQTIATLICSDLLTKPYLNTGGSREELAIDMENTVIVLVGLIPWCLACTVPLTFFNVGMSTLLWALYLYLVPLCYFFTKKRFFSVDIKAAAKESHGKASDE